jgi:hypothetical protein
LHGEVRQGVRRSPLWNAPRYSLSRMSTKPASKRRPLAIGALATIRSATSDASAQAYFAAALVVLLAAWLYVIMRATNVAFTHDEAISYGIINGIPSFVDSANNQFLNTELMRLSQWLFGESELALRLPNVLAFAIYGSSCLLLLTRLHHFAAKCAGLALLIMNPFLLEFFGLARGYGLSLAFLAGAFACTFHETRTSSGGRRLIRVSLVGLFGVLAFYANFSSLNLVLALLLVAALDTAISGRVRQRVSRSRDQTAALAMIAVAGACLIPGLLRLRHMQVTGQLYYGGHNGPISDTIDSLLGASSCGYECRPHWLTAGAISVIAVIALGISWAVGSCLVTRSWSNAQRAGGIFAISALAVVMEFVILGTLYPIDRTALAYLVAFAGLVAFTLDDALSSLPWRPLKLALGAAVVCFVVIASVNFAKEANVEQTTIWSFDASSHQVIDTIVAIERKSGRPQRPWLLISGFPREEALNYYRLRFKLTWLQPVTREATSTPGADLYDVSVSEVDDLPPGTKLLASYPRTGTQLRAASGFPH